MGKFYGPVGYSQMTQTSPGVLVKSIVEKQYFGDVIKTTYRVREGQNLNDNVVIDNRLSIVADPFAYKNYSNITYVEWMWVFWKVSSVDVQYPRLILTIGEVYNGQKA